MLPKEKGRQGRTQAGHKVDDSGRESTPLAAIVQHIANAAGRLDVLRRAAERPAPTAPSAGTPTSPISAASATAPASPISTAGLREVRHA
jgi:hypothetical protein